MDGWMWLDGWMDGCFTKIGKSLKTEIQPQDSSQCIRAVCFSWAMNIFQKRSTLMKEFIRPATRRDGDRVASPDSVSSCLDRSTQC